MLLDALDRHATSGGHFHVASRDPWRFIQSPDQRAWVAFQERSFAVVAWRDPIGPPDARSEALASFRRYAERVGKHAVVLGASDALEADARSLGFGSVWIGGEPFFDLRSWSTAGKRGEKLRLAVNHMKRVGGSAREIFPTRSAVDRMEMQRVERDWKAARSERENRSFLRTEPLENAEHRRFFAVETGPESAPTMQSFLVCSPVSGRGWYLQDLVRHPNAPRGAAEMVTVHAMHRLRDDGFDFATMGIVPLYDPKSLHGLQRSAEWTLRYFDKLYRFSGLKQFRSKFAESRTEGVHVVHWPPRLNPLVVWNIASVLSRPA